MNAPAHAALCCFHCGLPLAADGLWPVTVDGVEQATCCPGCQAVARAIVANGCSDYYDTRSAFAARSDPAQLAPPQLPLYDSAAQDGGAGASEAILSVEGIRCAACVWLIERRLARLPGVLRAEMNVATERLQVRWTHPCKPSDVVRALREIGYAAYPYDPVRHGEQLERERKTLFRRLFIAGLSMMQVMMYALPAYLAGGDGSIEPDMLGLMRWASLALTLPAVLYSAQPMLRGAWIGLRQRMPGMDLPVALAIVAAFGASALATWRGAGEVYFDSITMFIFLLLGSRYLELGARRKAARALENLQNALPASAWRLDGWPGRRDATLVAAAELRAGDIILAKPGEAIAADGVIVEGATELDLALLTGESCPQRRARGDQVPGGAVNLAQAIVLRATGAAADSTLSMLVRLAERAGQGKPRLALWADQVAAWSVAALLLLTAAVFIGWQLADPARAWPVAIAVLVVSCPCALSLATPAALAAASERLLREGVLAVRPHVLETLARATHIVFDKTGTLTEGKPVLRELVTFNGAARARCLEIAAALEQGSAHPVARAIHAATPGGGAQAQALRHAAGEGVEGSVDGVAYRLGSAAFVQALGLEAPPEREPDDASPVYLGTAAGWLARFELADGLRADAAEVVRFFQARGKTVLLLSGDRNGVTRSVAARLGIDGAFGEHLPQQKLALVQRLQAGGAVVAMVGDGINDAAVLGAADVSFAMGGGAALALVHADCVLLSGRLSALTATARTAQRTAAVVRQNLAWASAYNLLAIPAAAAGLLNPWLSGVGMSLSSAVVVLNALRLRRAEK